jgi:hypothetical protein
VVNPAEIIDSLVELLRKITDLVAEVANDDQRIFAYHDRYPNNVSLEMARYEMPSPSVMVAYQGTAPGGFGGIEAWRHEFSISLRAKDEPGYETPDAYYRLFRLIVKGVPVGESQPMENLTVHSSCNPMDTPTMRRQTDQAGVDFFEISVSFTEMGDN